ncbi:molecular chaperone Hsp90 [Candidatus Omnitrophus magneticus]|uniref:Chaperone protein HtpG n=1 Tax=Candidatus Omnitrophus magneticus TaxID=1609969 RepID=A0A0F0CMW2_9BACT|nr:molecular chaperone Hsp90 [Candidatus Omnitrophus magneticus]
MKQILKIIIHSLYTHPEIFLRELISNAQDALNKARIEQLTNKNFSGTETSFEIKIQVDSKTNTFSIEDTGIGMKEEELINNFGTIARSGTLEFLEELKKKGSGSEAGLIGQFGVGFYSVFMVADEVVVETKHISPNAKAYRWKSMGESDFTIEEIEKSAHGTKIYFTFKENAKEFSEEYRLENIIEKYSNFADFPILLNNKQINKIGALWRKKSSETSDSELNEFYKFITNDTEDPLGHIHLSVEGAVVNFKALLFIPKEAPWDMTKWFNEKGVHLYSNKILIQRECKALLPDYLRFTRGVLDTIDLPLNVSREFTQDGPFMIKIKNILTDKILKFLDDWAAKEPDKYKIFYSNFGPLLKSGINSDYTNRDKLIELLRFESSLKGKGELVSLKEYSMRAKSGQNEIYYIAGDSREALEKRPNMEYFRKNDIEVLYLSDPIDMFILPGISEYDKKIIKSIEKEDISLKPEEKIEKPESAINKSLLALFKEVLTDRVMDVVESKRLVDSAVTLVAGKDSMDREMEKMMKMMNKDYRSSKKILEVNMEHPVIKGMSQKYIANSSDPLLKKYVLNLYEGALFVDGELKGDMAADYVRRVNEIMEQAISSK